MIKYDIVSVDSCGLFRIRALRDIVLVNGTTVKAGDLGGLMQGDNALSQDGNCWIDRSSVALGPHTSIEGNALLSESSVVTNAKLDGSAYLERSHADFAIIEGSAHVRNSAVSGNLFITGKTLIWETQLVANGVLAGPAQLDWRHGYVYIVAPSLSSDLDTYPGRLYVTSLICHMDDGGNVFVCTNYQASRISDDDDDASLDDVIRALDIPVCQLTGSQGRVLCGERIALLDALEKLSVSNTCNIAKDARSLYAAWKPGIDAAAATLVTLKSHIEKDAYANRRF